MENKKLKIVSITGCAAGIAHTFMAAEGIESTAKKLGHKIKVETHGTAGPENVLTSKEIREADLVLIAADINVNLDRFIGKDVYVTNTKKAISAPEELISDAIKGAKKYKTSVSLKSKGKEANIMDVPQNENKKSYVVKHIMYALGWMVPLVIASGLVMALGNMFAIDKVWNPGGYYDVLWGFNGKPVAGVLFSTGAAGMGLIYPVIAAGIAYSIAGKITFAPAFIGGWIMNDGNFLNIHVDGSPVGTGFLGAIAIGFFVGYFAQLLKKIKWSKNLKGIASLMIIPTFMTLTVGLLSRYLFGPILGPITIGMFDGLEALDKNLGASGAILIGAIVGGMIATDLGGPINKTALVFGTAIFLASVEQSSNPNDWNFVPGTATQAAISIPPLAAFFSVNLFGRYFTAQEKTLGTNAGIMACFGISEAAIPFAVSKPKVFVPANIFGGMLAGALVSAAGFQFFGGLGSPLGAIFGYIPLGTSIPYIFAIILWLLVIVFAALMTSLLIFVGLILTTKKSYIDSTGKELKEESKIKIKALKTKLNAEKITKLKFEQEIKKIKDQFKIDKAISKKANQQNYLDLTQTKKSSSNDIKNKIKAEIEKIKIEIQKAKNNKSFQQEKEKLNNELDKLRKSYKITRKELLSSKDMKISERFSAIKTELSNLGQKEEKAKIKNQYFAAKRKLSAVKLERKDLLNKNQTNFLSTIA